MINGVALIVNGIPITTYDITKVIKQSGKSEQFAIDFLTQNALEEAEIKRMQIKIEQKDIDRFIQTLVVKNRLNSQEEFFQALQYQGISKSTFLKKIKKEILKTKLFQKLSSILVSKPTDREIRDYYNSHKKEFLTSTYYDLTFYQSRSKEALLTKIQNPLLYIPTVIINSHKFQWDNISEQLQTIVQNLQVGEFSKITYQNGGYISIYINDKGKSMVVDFKKAKNLIFHKLFTKQQEVVLKDYFENLKRDAKIKFIR
jgi:hypothetical protein